MIDTGLEHGEATALLPDSVGASRPRMRYPHHRPTGRPGVGSRSGSLRQLPAGVAGHPLGAGHRATDRRPNTDGRTFLGDGAERIRDAVDAHGSTPVPYRRRHADADEGEPGTTANCPSVRLQAATP